MARDYSTKYHGVAGDIDQKHWTIKRPTVDKFDGENKFLMGVFKPKILETWKDSTNFFCWPWHNQLRLFLIH